MLRQKPGHLLVRDAEALQSTDGGYAPHELMVTVAGLPPAVTVKKADRSAVLLGDRLTAAELSGLNFAPVSPQSEAARPGSHRVVYVPQNWGRMPLPLFADLPVGLTADAPLVLAELPSNGLVFLANGSTALTRGQVITAAQLNGLMFRPVADAAGHISLLRFCSRDQVFAAEVLLVVGPGAPSGHLETDAAGGGDALAPIAAALLLEAGLSSLGSTAASASVDPNDVLPTGSGDPVAPAGAAGPAGGPILGQAAPAAPPVIAPAPAVSSPMTAPGPAQMTAPGAHTTDTTDTDKPTNTSLSGHIGSSTPPEAGRLTLAPMPQSSPPAITTTPASASVVPTSNSAPLSSNSNPLLMQASLAGPTSTQTTTTQTLSSDLTLVTANPSPLDPITPNAIVLENEKQGTPQSVWQVDPGQDSTELQGFTTAISTDIGSAVQFKIDNLTGNSNYQIQIYRLGYYGGDGARLVTTLQHSGASPVQPDPITDPTTGEVDAGNWSVTDSWSIPTDAVSGVYIANVVQGDQVFQIPFVVKDPNSTSDIVFQTADETWQAYNGWGGANLYGGNGPSSPPSDDSGEAVPGAAYAVSYNRPIVTRDGVGQFSGPQDTVFGAEYAAIYWMEENGYDVSYISGMDTATNGSLLLNHKVFMDAGHDEYWTASQVANVQAAKDAGVNLVFLSGNEMFWQTQFTPSIDGSDSANRTLVSYKDSHFEQLINPSGQGTGAFEAPVSWGGQNWPSNALTGQLFSVDQTPTLGTITIPYDMTQLRFWRNTSIADTAPGQTASLENGLLGYEWDSSPDNGFMPAGLINVSSTTLLEPSVNAEFGNDDITGNATHNLVEYRDPVSGALVFGAGTVFWSWGLSNQHDPGPDGNTTETDPNVQQAMVNLFADMGVQPQTLEASLVIASASTDHTAPTSQVTNVSSTNAVEGTTVTVGGTATDVGGVIGGVQISTDGGQTWHVANSQIGTQSVNWTYTFNAPAPGAYTIETRAVDDSLNLETPGAGTSYTSTPSTALSLFAPSATPDVADEQDNNSVEVGMKFTSATNGEITAIRFYKGPTNTGTHVADLWSSTGTLLATATFTNETASGWQQVELSTPVQITAGTTYVVSYHTSGNYSDTLYYFDTYFGQTNGSLTAPGEATNGVFAYGPDSIFPNNVAPSGNNYWVDVVFNDTAQSPQVQNLNGLTVAEDGSLTIPVSALLANASDPFGLAMSIAGVSNAVNGTVTYDATAQTVTFTPNTGFAGGASFTFTVTDTSGATGSAQALVDVINPSAESLFSSSATPSVVNSNDANSVELGVQFTTSVSGVITGIRFYKGAANTGTHIADLWSADGTLLATATFTNETASGWQQVNFSTPVSVTAGATYVASYHTNGDYSDTPNYFTTAVTSGDLTASAGVFAYGSNPAFPTQTFDSTNYWVDVVFDGTTGSSQPVANNDSGFVVNENGSISIQASALLANDSDTGGLPISVSGVGSAVNGIVSYDPNAKIVTFTPTAGYFGPASFNYSITDSSGGAASATVSLTVNNVSAESVFNTNATPTGVFVNDPNSVELGMKFTADANGVITGVRFYKGAENTGPHVADLWSSNGTLLATATFTNETASGWQQVDFSSPVAITAGTTYVVSYHTSGDYSADNNYFTSPVVNGDLTVPTDGGVYAYGSGSAFPTQTYQASNYWVDVVYTKSLVPPVAVDDSGFVVAENGSTSIAASALLGNDTDPNSLALSITGVGNATNGTVSYDAQAQSVTFTPNAGYTGAASFSYSIVDASGGTASATASLIVNDPTTASLFNPTTAPSVVAANDPNAVELGVKFQASEDGQITGLRFYKAADNTGTHVADLWSSDGTLLATATFTNETPSGWQQVNFSSPVAITAGTTYVASYHTDSGDYSADANLFATAVTNGPLTAPSSSSSGGNGVFAYGSSSMFPTNSFNSTSYGVDVVFKPQLAT